MVAAHMETVGGRKCGIRMTILSTICKKEGAQKDFLYVFAIQLPFSLFLMHPIMPSLHVLSFPLTNWALHFQMLSVALAICCFPACQPQGECQHCFHLAVQCADLCHVALPILLLSVWACISFCPKK